MLLLVTVFHTLPLSSSIPPLLCQFHQSHHFFVRFSLVSIRHFPVPSLRSSFRFGSFFKFYYRVPCRSFLCYVLTGTDPPDSCLGVTPPVSLSPLPPYPPVSLPPLPPPPPPTPRHHKEPVSIRKRPGTHTHTHVLPFPPEKKQEKEKSQGRIQEQQKHNTIKSTTTQTKTTI